jgi:hypothetical protein
MLELLLVHDPDACALRIHARVRFPERIFQSDWYKLAGPDKLLINQENTAAHLSSVPREKIAI